MATIQCLRSAGHARYAFSVTWTWAVMLVLALGFGLRDAQADIYSWTDDDGVAHFTNV